MYNKRLAVLAVLLASATLSAGVLAEEKDKKQDIATNKTRTDLKKKDVSNVYEEITNVIKRESTTTNPATNAAASAQTAPAAATQDADNTKARLGQKKTKKFVQKARIRP